MKKTFDEPTKKQPRKEKTSRDAMTPGMQEVYDDFYGDPDFIENEWNFCSLQYERAKIQSFSKESTFDNRMVIRKISSYWLARKKALEM